MDSEPVQALLRTPCADGVHLFCSESGGWAIRREGAVIASGKGDRTSVEAGINRFLGLTSSAASAAGRVKTG